MEFNGFYQVWENFCHLVVPCERGEVTHCLAANLIINFEVARECNQVPRDARDDDILACLISDVGAHFKCQEALPFPILLVP
jgi:hypothetical protein